MLIFLQEFILVRMFCLHIHVHTFNPRESMCSFKNYGKRPVQTNKHTQTRTQCSHTSVGLTRAYMSMTLLAKIQNEKSTGKIIADIHFY